MLFKRKNEFKPDKTHSGALNKLYLTKKQRVLVGRWILVSLLLIVVSLVQDVILSRFFVAGATTDLLSCAILLACILYDPEVGSIFALTSSTLYWFSGSAPGVYVILLIPMLGINGASLASLLTQVFINVVLGFLMKPIRRSNILMLRGLNPGLMVQILSVRKNRSR
jgi:hypothetical protein